jgi:TonB dependent receptor
VFNRSGRTSFSQRRARGGLFIEPLWSPVSELSVSAAARLDVPERFGPEVSPRVGIGYTLSRTGTQLRAAWDRGFKLPSLFALADPLVGNPHLAPERSEGGRSASYNPCGPGNSKYRRPPCGTASRISSISARNRLPSSTAPRFELRVSKAASP